MTIIGFDVSKHELVGVRINKLAKIQEEYTILNQNDPIHSFLRAAKEKYAHLLMASEATAEYHRYLAIACIELDIPFRLINPLVTKQLTRVTIRKQKTDLSDAYLIAKSALQGAGTLVGKETFDPAKVIARTASKLGMLSGVFLRTKRHLEEVIPENNDLCGELENLRLEIEQVMEKFRNKARESVDPKLQELLASIPGIGVVLASVFITELAPLQRFSSQKALVAYAGLDPKIKQSGVSLKRNTHLTKRGSPYLRRAAYIAASIAQRHDPDLKNYYGQKRAEGKRYREATIANARHILYRVYAVWKRGTPYEARNLSTTH